MRHLNRRSMILGASAFFVYAAMSSFVLRRFSVSTLVTTLALLPLWLIGAVALVFIATRVRRCLDCISPGSVEANQAHQYGIRFLVGGLCTVAAGLIGKHFGPAIGGLFLAFPAIFPAAASLIESHEKENKRRIGANGALRGRLAASIDSAGAALGCFGLIGFAVTSWSLLRATRQR